MSKYTYKVVEFIYTSDNKQKLTDELNDNAVLGYELVSTESIKICNNTIKIIAILRKKY